MKNLLSRFWRDEAGFVISSELVLVATILVIGLIAGLTAVRDGVVQELGDVGQAIGAVSQSYSYNGVVGHTGASAGSKFVDQTDFCDRPNPVSQAPPACMVLNVPAQTGTGDFQIVSPNNLN